MAVSMNLRCWVSFAVIGILVGMSVFLSFGFALHNWDCAFWGLLSGVFAACTLYLHVHYHRDAWLHGAYHLRPYMLAGCVGQLAAVCGFVTYLTLAITEHQALTAYGRGYYLACVWCAITWKWAFQQFYFARKYMRAYEQKTGLPSNVPYESVP